MGNSACANHSDLEVLFHSNCLIIRSGSTVFIEHVKEMTVVALLNDVLFGNITYKLFLISFSKLAP